MRFQVLGCSGAIGDGHHTTSFLIDDDIALDAGTGLGRLALDELCKIDHVFLSHAHMDHIALLPMLVDATLSLRDKPITVYGLEATLAALSDHVFNWQLYPDFRKISAHGYASVKFQAIEPGETLDVASARGNQSRRLCPIAVNHSVPAVGYHLSSGGGSMVVATDMTVSDAFWPPVNAINDLQYLLIETSFQNARLNLCEVSGHLCPSLLEGELAKLEGGPEITIVHMKPSARRQIEQEISALDTDFTIHFARDGDVLEFQGRKIAG